MNINEAAAKIHRTALEHGWWEGGERNFGEMVALMHSELSEALEAKREDAKDVYWRGAKPEGWAVELIDCVIRIFDTLSSAKIDIEHVMEAKMAYNDTRPYKHGGKLF